MKIKLYKILGFVLILSMFTVSCDTNWIDPEMNEDPNALTDVTMKSLISQSQLALFFTMGDAEMTGFPAAWGQHLRGADRQFGAVNNYSITPADVDNPWSGHYENNLDNLQIVKEKANEQNSPHYAGVAKVMEAVTLELMTMYWGDLAYSDAFQGDEGNYQPEFDSQQEIFTTIRTLLDEAITDLQAEENEIPLEGDMVYKNEVGKWLKLAHSVRARVNMHFTQRGDVSYADVISDIESGITTNASDFQLPFQSDLARANPMAQFLDQRAGYMKDNQFFLDFVSGDPREDVLYYEPSAHPTKEVAGFWYQPSSPVALVENAEMYYLKAEAHSRAENYESARTALKNAIEASLTKYGVMDEAWYSTMSGKIDAASDSDLMKMIMEDKYIHMFGNPIIAYCDYRRTGYPESLAPVTGDEFPERFPYPQDEISYNSNTPDHGSAFNNLWIFPNN